MHDQGSAWRWIGFIALLLCPGCGWPSPPTPQTPATSISVANSDAQSADSATRLTSQTRPVVLLDSYHAHNFIDRGLVPGETNYHLLHALRRAVGLLEARGAELREWLVTPLTDQTLSDVNLLIVNLPSMDRPPWLVSEIAAVESYIRRGGGVLFLTDHSNCYYHQYHLLPLWERLGLIPTFETVCDADPRCQLTPGAASWISITRFEDHPVTRDVRCIAFQTGGRVVGQGTLAWTSDQGWADVGAVPMFGEGSAGLYGDLQRSTVEELARQGVVLACDIDRGRVVVISDQNCVGDVMLGYADNWRLWLGACRWASRCPLDAITQVAPRLLPKPSTPLSAPASEFERILSSARSEQAAPNNTTSADAAKWRVECWEPLTSGPYSWGGEGANQFHYLWCWLNRFGWVSATDRSTERAPPELTETGTPVLLWIQSDQLDNAIARQYAARVLESAGKVIVLPRSDAAVPDEANANSDTNGEEQRPRPSDDQQARMLAEKMLGGPGDARDNSLQSEWREEPLGHWHMNCRKWVRGTLIVVPDASRLQNAKFERAELSLNASSLKWQARLHRWLFEQP